MSTPVSESVIALRGGLCVPLAALQVLWALEARGFRLTPDEDSLLVAPRAQITADDDRTIRAHRDDLLALVRSVEVM